MRNIVLEETPLKNNLNTLKQKGVSFIFCVLFNRYGFICGDSHIILDLELCSCFSVYLKRNERIPILTQDMNMHMGKPYSSVQSVIKMYHVKVLPYPLDNGSYSVWNIIKC